jgi:hypothetical protein
MTTGRTTRPDTYRVVASVTHERLDDEVIAIDLDRGTYFGFDDVASDCWTVLAAGGSLDDAIAAVVARYQVPADEARRDLETFTSLLVDEGLLLPSDEPPLTVQLPAPAGAPLTYRRPAVERFDDLEDLLLLDPIHEVDDAGWPVARKD